MQLSPSTYHSLVRPAWFTNKYIHQTLKKHYQLNNKRILDFGAGTGANCLIANPANYLGVDVCSKRIAFAKNRYPEYNFKAILNQTLPAENQKYDYIFLIAVMHHIAPTSMLDYMFEFKRILHEKGKIIVLEPFLLNKKCFSNWVMNTLDRGKYIRHEKDYLLYFPKAWLQNICQKQI